MKSTQAERVAVIEAFDLKHAMAPFTPTGRGQECISRCRNCGMEVVLDPNTGRTSGQARISKCIKF